MDQKCDLFNVFCGDLLWGCSSLSFPWEKTSGWSKTALQPGDLPWLKVKNHRKKKKKTSYLPHLGYLAGLKVSIFTRWLIWDPIFTSMIFFVTTHWIIGTYILHANFPNQKKKLQKNPSKIWMGDLTNGLLSKLLARREIRRFGVRNSGSCWRFLGQNQH